MPRLATYKKGRDLWGEEIPIVKCITTKDHAKELRWILYKAPKLVNTTFGRRSTSNRGSIQDFLTKSTIRDGPFFPVLVVLLPKLFITENLVRFADLQGEEKKSQPPICKGTPREGTEIHTAWNLAGAVGSSRFLSGCSFIASFR